MSRFAPGGGGNGGACGSSNSGGKCGVGSTGDGGGGGGGGGGGPVVPRLPLASSCACGSIATTAAAPSLLPFESTLLMREGSLVQLRGLLGMSGLSYNGNFDAPLAPYEGRKGRVSRSPPAWVIKAAPEPVIISEGGGDANQATATIATPAALVPVLLDSRSTDRDRGQGVWLAVPPENLMVLN